ncbi:hypothetical protein WA577_002722 [Blastocystis sp. JDR]
MFARVARTTAVAFSSAAPPLSVRLLRSVSTESLSVYTYGKGAIGALGHNDYNDREYPCRVDSLEGRGIHKIACGWAHNCLVDGDGEMVIFGRTQDVRNIIGAGNMISYLPKVIRSFNNFFKNTVIETRFPSVLPIEDGKCVDVAASMALSFCLTDTHHIYAYGYNRYGQCGVDMKDVNLYAPKQVMLDEDEIPVKLACGFQHACCLCESGRVYAWGKANHGQLGRGDVDMTFKPLLMDTDASIHYRDVYAGFSSSILISDDGKLYIAGKYWGDGQNRKNAKMFGDSTYPRLVPLDHQIDLFASGQFHMTYTDTKGQLYQLGLEDSETCRTIEEESKRDESKRMHREPVPVDMSSIQGIRFKKLRCSFTESYGITEDGDVYKWNWLSPPAKVKILDEIKVEDISFGWKHVLVLGSPRKEVWCVC